MTISERKPLRVGEWVADPATNELRRGSGSVRLEPKPMDVLMELAARPGEVVSREELLAHVWAGVVVTDETLTQAIARLRRALGEGHLETIPKRGYRLVAPVGPYDAEIPLAPKRRRAIWAAAGAVLLILAVAAYLLLANPAATPVVAGDEVADRLEPWVTVTVAPFEDLSGERTQAHFARGMTQALMAELGTLSGLRVTSAGGRYGISGSVQRGEGALRVNVRLIDARSGVQLWAESYQRPYTDLFAVQDDIVQRLAAALPAQVSEAERRRLSRRHTRSLEAYDLFLRAQSLFLARQSAANAQARELYRKAIAIDPRFARAYAGLAMTYAIEPRLRRMADPKPANDRALELAESARMIDPDIAEVHWALGFIHAQARRHPEAIAELERVIELNPSFADAYALIGGIHTYIGQPQKSIPLLRTAMRLDPVGGYLYYLLLGRAYLFQDDAEQALINLREAAARNPADLETRIYLAAAQAAAGNREAARWEAEEVRTLQKDFSVAAWLAGYPLASEPHREKLKAMLAAAGL